jgi:hypothetical protein
MEKDNSSLILRITQEEKSVLKEYADARSMTLSDYARKKLFEDNADIYNGEKMKCISPSGALHETLMAVSNKTIEASIIYLIHHIANINLEESAKVMKGCKEHAKENLKMFGYEVIKPKK